MMEKYEALMVIVNQGFSDTVMDIARQHGASGGTIINARGTARMEAEKDFGIVIHPEKEIVLILVKESIKNDILHGIYQGVGLDTAGQGIAFSLPVEEVVGLSKALPPKEEKLEVEIEEPKDTDEE